MNSILLILISASVFSIEGLGQEQTIFRTPFYGDLNISQIEFSLMPEFNILNKGSDLRGLFWINPFYLNMKIPIYKGLTISFGGMERFNQLFDIYSASGGFDMYVQGRGGIEELYLQFNQRLNFAEIFFRGSYLYGSSREIWNYTISGYSIADTFLYKNEGRAFSAGLKILIFSLFYEGMGRLNMTKAIDTAVYTLPQIIGFGIDHKISEWEYGLFFEHTSSENFNGVNRFKLMVEKKNFNLSYGYNPWYLSGVNEHLLGISIKTGLKNFAIIAFKSNFGIRTKGDLREFAFIPELRLVLEEVFARRKK